MLKKEDRRDTNRRNPFTVPDWSLFNDGVGQEDGVVADVAAPKIEKPWIIKVEHLTDHDDQD